MGPFRSISASCPLIPPIPAITTDVFLGSNVHERTSAWPRRRQWRTRDADRALCSA